MWSAWGNELPRSLSTSKFGCKSFVDLFSEQSFSSMKTGSVIAVYFYRTSSTTYETAYSLDARFGINFIDEFYMNRPDRETSEDSYPSFYVTAVYFHRNGSEVIQTTVSKRAYVRS